MASSAAAAAAAAAAPREPLPAWPHGTSATASCDSVPPGVSLVATYVVMRHGDRSPGANVFRGHDGEQDGDREYWGREVLGKQEIGALQASFPATGERGNCSSKWPYGRLTERGAEQAFRFGAHLRSIYGAQLAASAAEAAAPGGESRAPRCVTPQANANSHTRTSRACRVRREKGTFHLAPGIL